MFPKQGNVLGIGIGPLREGTETELYHFNHSRGFSGIPEGVLKTCHKELIQDSPEAPPNCVCPDHVDDVVLDLLRDHQKDLPDHKAKKLLYARNPVLRDSEIANVPEDLLFFVVGALPGPPVLCIILSKVFNKGGESWGPDCIVALGRGGGG